MTLTEISKMAYSLATAHYINDIKWASANELKRCLSHWLHKDNDSYISLIALPDGKWHCKFIRHNDYYDLFIPETREQESRLIQELKTIKK